MRIGLSVYGTPYNMGINPLSGRPRITATELIDKALELGLEGAEIPIELMENEDPIEVAEHARKSGAFFSLETVGFDPDNLKKCLELAARMGAPTLRTFIGGARLGGDRRPLAGQWKQHIEKAYNGLAKALETAERLGVNLALENHQDACSEELLWLCESFNSKYFGVILDTANALATVEEPLDFTKKIAKYVKHVHLKDYWVYLTDEGYRLARCPIGYGFMDFPGVFEELYKVDPNMTMAIEIGALESRHVRAFSEDFWLDYPKRSAADLAKVVQFVLRNQKNPNECLSPYERRESIEAILEYENRELALSIEYVKNLAAKYKA